VAVQFHLRKCASLAMANVFEEALHGFYDYITVFALLYIYLRD